MRKQLGIAVKISMAMGVLVAGFVLMFVLTQWFGMQTQHRLSIAAESLFPAALKSQEAEAAFGRLVKRYNDAVMVQDKDGIKAAGQEGPLIIAALRSVSAKPDLTAARKNQVNKVLGKLPGLIEKSGRAYSALIDGAGKPSEDIQAQVMGLAAEYKINEDAIRKIREDLTGDFQEELSAERSSASRQMWLEITLCVIVIFAVSPVIFFTVRRVNQSLEQVTTQLAETAREVSNAARQVSSSSQDLAKGASAQAISLEETAASSEEVAAMTRKTALNSRNAATLMCTVDQQVKNGNLALGQLTHSMDEIQSSSRKISRIIKVIDEIAFQTNILALNAAVEAARAGEAGMGFAVVAEEVRNLAQRSAAAARDTATLIEESITKSNQGNGHVEQMAGVIRSVTGSAAEVKVLVDDVNQGTDHQTVGMEQISRALCVMDQTTQRTSSIAEASASASEELAAQAESLNRIVGQLRSLVGVQRSVAPPTAGMPDKLAPVTERAKVPAGKERQVGSKSATLLKH